MGPGPGPGPEQSFRILRASETQASLQPVEQSTFAPRASMTSASRRSSRRPAPVASGALLGLTQSSGSFETALLSVAKAIEAMNRNKATGAVFISLLQVWNAREQAARQSARVCSRALNAGA